MRPLRRLSAFEEGPEGAATVALAQLADRLGFDLADTLSGQVEDLSDLLEGVVVAHADAEAEPDHPCLAGREGVQDTVGLFAHQDAGRRLPWRDLGGVFDEVPEVAVVVTDRRFMSCSCCYSGCWLGCWRLMSWVDS